MTQQLPIDSVCLSSHETARVHCLHHPVGLMAKSIAKRMQGLFLSENRSHGRCVSLKIGDLEGNGLGRRKSFVRTHRRQLADAMNW